jgi:hypothetical protein
MPRSASPAAPTVAPGRRIQTRRSGVHGKGVFAVQDIAEGEVLVEYTGQVIGWQEAQDRHPHDPLQPNHTFYFHVDEDRVIDAKFGGNSSRWINHSCNPNCYADERDGRIFITALRNIQAGEELNYDYGLIIEERYTPKLKAEYPCWCGAANCRGTLLAPKRIDAPETLLRVAQPLVRAIQRFETHGFGPLRTAFHGRDLLYGQTVRCSDGLIGIARGVDASGALLVHSENGVKAITSAEVSVRPDLPAIPI